LVFHNTPESKAELMIWKHPHSPVKKMLKTVQSPGKVIKLWPVFWDVCGVLLVDFTPPSSTVNAAACQETKKTQRGYSEKETRIVDHSSPFAGQYLTSKCCHNCGSLELLGLANSSTSIIQS
jgi:hypothetical protein